MKYKLLSKMFYQDKSRYESLYKSRLESESTYRFDFEIKGYTAFVVLNHEILEKIQQILQLNKDIFTLTHLLPEAAINQYARTCLVDEIRMTNDIEGVYSTRKEIKEIILDKNPPKKYKRLYALVKKYETLLSNTEVRLDTCEDIRGLYDDFVLEDVEKEDPNNVPDGKLFRRDSVYVAGKHGETVHAGLRPEEEIIKCMTQSLEMLHDEDYSSFIRIAVFHYMFGYIHPFYDGNGRMSRFISSYLLAKELHFLVSCRLSCAIKDHISAYYKSFTIVNDEKNRGDLTSFVITFLDTLISAEIELCEALQDKRIKLSFYSDAIKHRITDAKVGKVAILLVQNTLFGDTGLSIKQIIELSDIGDTKVRSCIKELEDMKLIKKEKDGHGFVYDIDLERLVE